MAKNGFKVMDSDLPVLEPKDLWQQYIDPAFAARAPKGIDRHHSDMQLDFNGHVAPDDPSDWGADKAAPMDPAYQDSIENHWDSASQVRAMDLEGIDVAVLYPSRGLFALAFDTLDPDLGYAVARAYNDWMHDFFSVAPERMYGAVMVSPFDVNTAIDETRRGVEELGMKGVFIRPNVVNGRNWTPTTIPYGRR